MWLDVFLNFFHKIDFLGILIQILLSNFNYLIEIAFRQVD